MSIDKLYIKVSCVVCDGSLRSRSHHDPSNPYKWKRCPYCNEQGKTYIQATERMIREYLERISHEEEDSQAEE